MFRTSYNFQEEMSQRKNKRKIEGGVINSYKNYVALVVGLLKRKRSQHEMTSTARDDELNLQEQGQGLIHHRKNRNRETSLTDHVLINT